MDFEKEYTIKEFAELRGVSQQAVYKQLSKTLKPYVIERDGKKYISGQAFNQFNQPVGNSSTESGQPIESEIIQLLREQLKEKDRQISSLFSQVEQLTVQLSTKDEINNRLTILLENTQKIEAGRLLMDAKSEEAEPEPEATERRRGLFYIFKKNK